MAQSSWFTWTTDGTGDGTGTGYTMAQLSKMLHMLLTSGIANRGVLPGYLNGLAPSNPAGSTIRIETGGAQVHGTPYENDAQANFTPGDGTYPALPTNSQIHRVVLRKSWAAQTVRIAFISGTDAGSPSTPALTQTDLTTWEIPLCQFQINNAGTVSNFVDQREMLGHNLVFINDSANVWMTTGITINQGSADNTIFAFKSSDVAHGITSFAETDTYADFSKYAAASGGLLVYGFTSATVGLSLRGAVVTADTTKSTAGLAGVMIDSALKVGTGLGNMSANSNLMCVRDRQTTRFILDADGDSHQDVGTAWTNFHGHDDIALLNTLAAHLTRQDDPVRRGFSEWLARSRDPLERLRLVTFNEDGHHFVNWSRMHMLVIGAMLQQAEKLDRLQADLRVLCALLPAGGQASVL